MYHRNYSTYLQKELDFLKLLVSRFHEQEQVNDLELGVAMQKTQDIYEHFLKMKLLPNAVTSEMPTVPQAPPHRTENVDRPVSVEQDEKNKQSILAEKLSPTEFHPINETLAQQKAVNDLSKKLQSKPLASIFSGIGLNDKFLFIRELFNGDSDSYNNTVKQLDAAGSLEEAMTFIQTHFDWDENNENVQNFLSLVHRRHSLIQ